MGIQCLMPTRRLQGKGHGPATAVRGRGEAGPSHRQGEQQGPHRHGEQGPHRHEEQQGPHRRGEQQSPPPPCQRYAGKRGTTPEKPPDRWEELHRQDDAEDRQTRTRRWEEEEERGGRERTREREPAATGRYDQKGPGPLVFCCCSNAVGKLQGGKNKEGVASGKPKETGHKRTSARSRGTSRGPPPSKGRGGQSPSLFCFPFFSPNLLSSSLHPYSV